MTEAFGFLLICLHFLPSNFHLKNEMLIRLQLSTQWERLFIKYRISENIKTFISFSPLFSVPIFQLELSCCLDISICTDSKINYWFGLYTKLQNIGKLGLPKGNDPGYTQTFLEDIKKQIKFPSAAEDQEHCFLLFCVFCVFCFLLPSCLHKLSTSWGLLKHWILLSECRGGRILDSDSRLKRQVLFSISICPSISVYPLSQTQGFMKSVCIHF